MTDWMRNVVWGNREAPAVYDDWTIDPATRIITHGPTGYRFEVFRPSAAAESFCARLVVGRPRTPEQLIEIGALGIAWYKLYGRWLPLEREPNKPAHASRITKHERL